jgi:hypothetical protein
MLISEQIHRCARLDALIKYPIEPIELYTLAERCKSLLKNYLESLKLQQQILTFSTTNEQLRTIYIEYRSIRRNIDIIENYGIAILKMNCEDLKYLNRPVGKIHNESCIPLQIASIASFSSDSYFFAHTTNVIFIPASDHTTVLNLPILYHELGHYISRNKDDSRLKNVKDAYLKCTKLFQLHYANELREKLLENAPEPIVRRPAVMLEKWKRWFEEFFCDCVATFLCGPAYAWTWLHTTAKISSNPFEYSDELVSSHPSDEARFRICLHCMNVSGHKAEIDKLKARWETLPNIADKVASTVYPKAYPDSLMTQIATNIHEALKKDSFRIYEPKPACDKKEFSITSTLNDGWASFWSEGDSFFEKETDIIEKLHSNI